MTRRLHPAEIRRELLTGAPVFGPANERVGTVRDVTGEGEDAMIAIGIGGILGMDGKTLVLPAALLRPEREENGAITLATDKTRHDLELLAGIRR